MGGSQQPTGAVPQGLLLEIEKAALKLRRKNYSQDGRGNDDDEASTAKGGATDLRRYAAYLII